MSDTRQKFEAFIAEYATEGTFDLTPCPEFPEQYDNLETQMLYDAFSAGGQLATPFADQPLLMAEVNNAMSKMADRIAKLEAELAMLTGGAELPENAQSW
jgi:hypothetical protein